MPVFVKIAISRLVSIDSSTFVHSQGQPWRGEGIGSDPVSARFQKKLDTHYSSFGNLNGFQAPLRYF